MPPEQEVLRHVYDTLLRVEKRLDAHIDDEIHSINCVREQVAKLRVEVAAQSATHNTKMTGMVTGVSMLVSACVAAVMVWLTSKLGK